MNNELVRFDFSADRFVKSDLQRRFMDEKIGDAIYAYRGIAESFIQGGHVVPHIEALSIESNWYETKNDYWILIRRAEEYDLLVRRHGTHFTFFFKGTDEEHYFRSPFQFADVLANRDHMDDDLSDYYLDDPITPLRGVFKSVVDAYLEKNLWMVWNNAYFEREKYIEVRCIKDIDSINHIDMWAFCWEEISLLNKYVSCEYSFKEMCVRAAPLEFNIPAYSKGVWKRLFLDDEDDPVFVREIDGEEEHMDIWQVFQWEDKLMQYIKWT